MCIYIYIYTYIYIYILRNNLNEFLRLKKGTIKTLGFLTEKN